MRLTSLLRLLLPAVLPRLPLLAGLLKSPLRLLLPAVLPRLLQPAVRLTSRKKSLLHAVPPAVPATSNHGFPPKSVPGGKILAGNLVNHSVTPIYIHIPKDKVMTI